MKRAALYVRVSTAGQTFENQRRELAAAARRHKWKVVVTLSDTASGKDGAKKRPGYDKLLDLIARRQVDLVAAWSVDRLGRSLRELVQFMGELDAKGVGLYLHKQGLDTTTPAGRAMFGMASVFAEFEREILIERIRAGQARARANGSTFGRPKTSEAVEGQILRRLKAGHGKVSIAKQLGVGVSVVQRIANETGTARAR